MDRLHSKLRQDTWNKPSCIKSKLKMQMLENEPSSWFQPLNKIYAKNIFQCFDFKIENQKVFQKKKNQLCKLVCNIAEDCSTIPTGK